MLADIIFVRIKGLCSFSRNFRFFFYCST